MHFRIVFPSCAALACALLSCGCASFDSSKQSLQLKPSDIVATVFKPEYKVRDEPVTAVSQQKHFLFFSWGDADLFSDPASDPMDFDKPEVRRLKKAASARACNASNCDLLVATTYQIERTGFLVTTVRCTIKGFPTDVVSVHPVDSPAVAREIDRTPELAPLPPPPPVVSDPAEE